MATAFGLLITGGIINFHAGSQTGVHIASIGGIMVLIIIGLDMYTEKKKVKKNE
jgi:hypothetical protein